MKLKDLKGFPKEKDAENELGYLYYNQALSEIGEIEVEIDDKKMFDILNKYDYVFNRYVDMQKNLQYDILTARRLIKVKK